MAPLAGDQFLAREPFAIALPIQTLTKVLSFFGFIDANVPLIINIREPVFGALLEAVSYLICNSVQKLPRAFSQAPLSSRDAE